MAVAVLLKDACSFASAPRNGDVNRVRSQKQRNQKIHEGFPFIVSQAPLRRDFRVSTRSCGDHQKVLFENEPKITGSINPRAPAPPAPEPEPESEPEGPANPGNDKSKGGSGEDPSGKGNMGSGSKDKNK